MSPRLCFRPRERLGNAQGKAWYRVCDTASRTVCLAGRVGFGAFGYAGVLYDMVCLLRKVGVDRAVCPAVCI